MALEVFASAQNIFRKSIAICDFLKTLPQETEIGVRLIDRIDCTLRLVDNEAQLDEGLAANADIEISLGNEILRKWTDKAPDEISDLALTLLREGAMGQVRIRLMRPSRELIEKGYLKSVTALGPKVQAELMQKGFVILSQAQGMFEMAKGIVQETIKETLNKK